MMQFWTTSALTCIAIRPWLCFLVLSVCQAYTMRLLEPEDLCACCEWDRRFMDRRLLGGVE